MSPTGINYLNHFGNGESWSSITGCTHAGSPGCDNCWARVLHEGRNEAYWRTPGLMPEQYAEPFSEIQFHEKRLDQPSRWRKPRVIGVCFGGDLFHPNVRSARIGDVVDEVFSIPRHTFLFLTKRPVRMRDEMESLVCLYYRKPIPNLWLGVTVCNQQEADEKIPILLDTPAAHRWVSYEPALGPVDFGEYLGDREVAAAAHEHQHARRRPHNDPYTYPEPAYDLTHRTSDMHADDDADRVEGKFCYNCDWLYLDEPGLDLVVAGGESGTNARPANPQWFRDVRDQCADAGVPFFMKQMAGRKPIPDDLMVRQLPWEPPA